MYRVLHHVIASKNKFKPKTASIRRKKKVKLGYISQFFSIINKSSKSKTWICKLYGINNFEFHRRIKTHKHPWPVATHTLSNSTVAFPIPSLFTARMVKASSFNGNFSYIHRIIYLFFQKTPYEVHFWLL